jgi:hypothetical protein
MRLRVAQVQRLCGIDGATSARVLQTLVGERFLTANPDGTYVRATEGHDPDRRNVHVMRAPSPAK